VRVLTGKERLVDVGGAHDRLEPEGAEEVEAARGRGGEEKCRPAHGGRV
jgi:hypothetical protein